MLKKAVCIAAVALMAACSSESVSDPSGMELTDSAMQDQPVAQASSVEDYEVNETTMTGEQRNADFVNKLDDEQLAVNLRDGGYVIYVRHAKTDKDWGDQVSSDLDLSDCSTQRRLSVVGKADAKLIGEGIKTAGIPVGDVISSEYCRAYNTAELAFGRHTKNPDLNFLPCVECTPEDYQKYSDRLSPLLSQIPEDGTNTFLVGHDDPFQGVTMAVEPPNGIYPAPMGVAYVVQPMGDGQFELIAKILPTEWQQLAEG